MTLRSILGIFASALLVVGCAETDAGITTNVKSKLVSDDLVKARQIDVDTQEGVVTLTGTVQSSEEEAQALQLARDVSGVTSVVDNITVSPDGEQNAAPTTGYGDAAGSTADRMGDAAADAGITAKVKTALMADDTVKGLQIDVDTSGGVVTLSGNVNSQAEKTKAVEIAGQVEDVARVEDKLTVRP
jgi:hyperosmotically inducible protein